MKSRHEATGLTFSEQVNVDYNLSLNPKTGEMFKAEHLVNRCQELYDELQRLRADQSEQVGTSIVQDIQRDLSQLELVGG